MPPPQTEPHADVGPRPPAPAVGRAFRVLQLLAREQAPLGVSQIAAALGLGKATVHALVHALVAVGGLEQAEEKRYRLGPVLETLAVCRKGWRTLETTCRPLLEGLAADLDQTAILGVPDGDRLRIAAVVEGRGELRIGATPGHRIPLLAGAHGKVVAAWNRREAPARRAKTEVPEGREEDLENVRRTGVAYDRGEYLQGVAAAAAPVLGPADGLLGVLYVVGLRELMGEPGLLAAGEAVDRAARLATRALRSDSSPDVNREPIPPTRDHSTAVRRGSSPR